MAYKVILFEDSPTVKKAIRMSLSPPDFELYSYDGMGEFLEKINQMKPAVILLSLSLVMRSGSRTLKDWKSREICRETAIILLRKVFDQVDQEKIAELDYDAILQLPFDSGRLVSLVRILMEKKKDPSSLPEEHLLDEFPPQERGENLDERIRALIKQEALEVKREWEERMRAQLIAEIKDWLLEKLDEIKGEEKSKT